MGSEYMYVSRTVYCMLYTVYVAGPLTRACPPIPEQIQRTRLSTEPPGFVQFVLKVYPSPSPSASSPRLHSSLTPEVQQAKEEAEQLRSLFSFITLFASR